MKTLKKTLALLLMLCMVLNVLSMTAMAVVEEDGGTTEPTEEVVAPTGESTPTETTASEPTPTDTTPTGDTVDDTVDDTTDDTTDDPEQNIALLSDDGTSSLTITEKPANGNTTGQPFATDTAGSHNFRIPGIVTLNDGTLIAVADARWTTNYDNGGLDTIVSVSKDNGANWEYTFANYLGDNGDTYNNLSTCFIDPAIATDGTTAYLIADLFPAGFAVHSEARYPAQSGSTGFDANGNLILRSDAENNMTFNGDATKDYATQAQDANYNYYLSGGKIYTTAGKEVEGYTVDAYFNIKGDDGTDTNLFFENSPYKPYPTNYLYMTTSTNGLNWSEPKLLNLKDADETVFLVGPGSGIAVGDRMVFTAYELTNGNQFTYLIWRNADGSWQRSDDAATTTTWSSEASVVDLGDNRLRVFYRDGNAYLSYTDFVWRDGKYVRDTSATSVATTAAKRSGSGCMLSAYKYSQKIEEKTAILVSTPAASDARDNGFLYVFLLNDDNTMELAYEYDIFPGENEDFAYSCITEMKDGTIALLYESTELNPCAITFTTIDLDDVTVPSNDARLNFIDVDLYVGDTWTLKDTTGEYESPAGSNYDPDVATVTATGSTKNVPAATTMYSGTVVALEDCLYTLTGTVDACMLQHTLSDGTEVYIDAHAGAGNTGYPNRTYTSELVLANSANTDGAIVIKDATGSLHLHKEREIPYWNQCGSVCSNKHDLLFFRPAESGDTSSEVFAGFVQVTDVADLEDGGQYLIAAANDYSNYYVLSPANGGGSKTSNDHLAKFTGEAQVSSTTVTIKALTKGETTVKVGSNVYNITVSEIPAKEVEVKENETVTETVSGAYFASDISGLNTNYATVELTVSGVTASAKLHESLNNSTEVTLEGSEYTFTDVGNGTWYATIKSGDSTYYVRPVDKGHKATETALTLEFNSNGSVYIKSFYTGTKYYYLYVDRSTLAWNRINSSDSSTLSDTFKTNSTFYIYGEGTDASSPIPGYKLITSNDQITSGGKYLIAFYDNNGQLYVMNPATLSTAAYNQMAQVVLDTTQASTTISITGVAEGTTSMILGDDEHKFDITVRPENYDPIAIPETENVYKGSAITITEKPANGTTVGQPFLTGTGGSLNFRIPGIVTLNDGTLIATTDARWNHAGDGAGLDTLVSVSTDNGDNWTYTFANYLGDNGNTFNNLSTSIIDPAIGTDGTTAYLIADLFPAGIALNTSRYSPVAGENGFDENGNLLLRDLAGDTVVIGQDGYNTMAAAREYNYYLKDNKIYTKNGTECTGFTVDEYFNISYTDKNNVEHKTNLFFADSPFQPYPTDYLYMTTSTDGLDWSAPKLLNLQEENEQTLLVGPGNGTYNETTGHMVFTAYEHTSGYERTCLIWKDAEGNWHRTADATVNFWSSEASVVALSDGTMRVFYRDGYNILHYTDYKWSGDANNYVRDPNATEVSTTAVKDAGCQLTAITYSEKIDGKEAVIVATPANPASRRTDGHLYVFLLNDDNTMELAYDYDIVPDSIEVYAYSCITEMDDGNIALLYEGDYAATNGGAEIIFTTINMDEVTKRDNDARLTFVDVAVLTEESVTVTDSTGDYTEADTSELKSDVATVAMSATNKTTMSAQLGSDATYSGDKIALEDCLYTFTKDDSGNWIIKSGDVYMNNNGTTGYPHSTEAATFTIAAGNEESTFYIRGTGDSNGKHNYLYFDRAAYNWNRVNTLGTNTTWMTNCSMSLFKAVDGEGSGEIPGYERVTSVDAVAEGEYLIAAKGNDGNWYVAYPSTAQTNRYCQIAKVGESTTITTTHITFEGVGEGYSEVQIGSTVYRVTVKGAITEEVSVVVGDSITIDTTYTGELTGLDTTYATAELADGTLTITGVYPGTTSVDLGRTRYNITVTGKVVKVDLTEGETASYVVSGTNADMTQPDSNVASTAFGTGYGAQLGSAQSTYAGTYTALENLLYTFASNGDGTWTVSSTTADGTTVYLEPYAKTNGTGYPNVTSPVAVTLSAGSADNSVYIYGNGGYLHFHRSSKLYFDRVTGTSTFEAACSFLLYRPAAEGETSSEEIPGFVLVEGKDAVTAGQYLIVAEYSGEYYMLYPTLSTAHRSAQIAHVVNNATTVEITGVGNGETSFRADATVFKIKVTGLHNVTLKYADGATPDGTLTVADGEKLTNLSTPEREGYTFAGWVDEDGNEVTAETVCTGDMTLTAQWTEIVKTHTVTLSYNDGTTASGKLTVNDGTKLGNLPTPVREGYTFNGWKDEAGNEVTAETVCTGDMTLTAQWTENAKSYTVTLNYNDGTTANRELTVADGAKLSDLPTPEREGYTFGGWKSTTGASVTKDTVVTGDMILVAQWTENAKSYTVTLCYNDGATVNGKLTVADGAKLSDLPTPTRDGYTFGGWKNSAGTTVTKDTVVTGDMTLTAQWTKNPAQTTTPSDPANPDTGDSFPMVLMVMLMLSSFTGLILLRKRKIM